VHQYHEVQISKVLGVLCLCFGNCCILSMPLADTIFPIKLLAENLKGPLVSYSRWALGSF
jgi:hypothetical protein